MSEQHTEEWTPKQWKEWAAKMQAHARKIAGQRDDLLAAAKAALEALFNLAPKFREKGCFDSQTDPCVCTACTLKAAIKKAETE